MLTVLTYHRIGESSEIGEFDPDVREVNADGLSDQIAVARAAGTIVSLSDVRAFFQGKRLPPNPIMIAFDDGYVECRTRVLPVLQKCGVAATFFIPTAFPDSGRIFWWDKINLILQRTSCPEIRLHYPSPLVFDLRGAKKTRAKQEILRLVKRTAQLDLERFLEELAMTCQVPFDSTEEARLAQKTILSFRDVRALYDAGMAIASHSHAHRVLGTLLPDEILWDLRKSRMILEDVLGVEVRTIGYPVGHNVAGFVRRSVALAGFDVGFTNATGLCWSGAADPLNVPRMAIGQDEPAEIYKWRMLVG